MTLGERIKKLRKMNNITQEYLAELLDTSRVSVSFWETDVNLPSIDKIVQLSDIFHVTTDYILKGEAMTSPVLARLQEDQALFVNTFSSLPMTSRIEVIKFIHYQEYLSRLKTQEKQNKTYDV